MMVQYLLKIQKNWKKRMNMINYYPYSDPNITKILKFLQLSK